MMQTGPKGLALIKKFEGWRSKAYPDPGTGGEPWTIGYGHTSHAGPPAVYPGMRITRAEGERILKRDLGVYEAAVNAAVRVELSQEQFDALVSFCYNVGPGALRKSSVLKAVNRRDWAAVPRRLALWNKAAGRVLPGLVRRRAAEGALFAEAQSSEKLALAEAYDGVDVPTGKTAFESTSNMATTASVAVGGVGAFAGLEFKVALLVFLLLLLLGGYLVWSRHLKSRDDAI